MTIGELVHGFRGWLDVTGHISTETNWSAELIYRHMLKFRAKYISDKINKGQPLSAESMRIVPCVGLVKAPRWECPCQPADGCVWMKTKIPVIRHIYIDSVSSPGGEISYDFLNWNDFGDKQNHRIPMMAAEPYYTHKIIGDDYWHFFYNSNHRKLVTYTMIPYDPIEYAMMPDCGGKRNLCLNAFDVVFPMDPDMEPQLFVETYSSLVAPRPKDGDVVTNQIKDLPGLPQK